MKRGIIEKLAAARASLGNIFVSEKQNGINMYGAMDIIEKVIMILENCEVTKKESQKEN